VAEIHRRNLGSPDEHVEYPLGGTDEVHLAELVVGRSRLQPGWRWSEHIRPIIGTPHCETHHVGMVTSGRFAVRMLDGREAEFGPDDVYDIPPGHDGWVVGDQPVELVEWVGVHRWASPPSGERILATLVFTDIFESTPLAQRLGDDRWARLLEDHNAAMRRLLDRYRGREVDTAGDGMLAMFDGAERAVRWAASAAHAVAPLGLAIRAGVHTGEVEVVPAKVRGISVHIAARIMALAGPGQVLVSGTTRSLIESGELTFLDHGTHELKGVTGARAVFALVPTAR